MANLLQTVRSQRSGTLTLDDYVHMLSEWGLHGQGPAVQQTMAGQSAEPAPNDFVGYVQHAYKANGVVFACELSRLMLFAQARFAFRRRNLPNGRPGDLFHTAALDILDNPWPNATTGDLLARMIQDADFAGNSYLTVIDGRVCRLRPDYVWIVLGSRMESDRPDLAPDAEVVGYFHAPPGGRERIFLPGEVAHFAPNPDPIAHFRGMSWLTPVLREVRADGAATGHKLKFFENAATPNLVVKHQLTDMEKVKRFAEMFSQEQEGLRNAYKTLHLYGGADAEVVGADFHQMDFKTVQAAGETRIANASGIHPTIVGLSEGLQGSSLNEGNFAAARRLTADRTLRFLWGNAAASLASIVAVPARAELFYDARDIPFLQEDEADAADIQAKQAITIRQLTDAGFTPESVVAAVTNGDMALLAHSGLYSVQLQPAGTTVGPSGNGNGSDDDPDRALQAIAELSRA